RPGRDAEALGDVRRPCRLLARRYHRAGSPARDERRHVRSHTTRVGRSAVPGNARRRAVDVEAVLPHLRRGGEPMTNARLAWLALLPACLSVPEEQKPMCAATTDCDHA